MGIWQGTTSSTVRVAARFAALAVAFTLLGGGATASSVAEPAPRADEPAASAWVLPGAPDRLVRTNAPALDGLGVVGVSLRADGRRLGRVPKGSKRLRRTAQQEGLVAELLFNNYSNSLGDFDPRAAHRLLSRPARIRRTAGALAAIVARQRWDGVNVDLERIRRKDAGGLVLLVEVLQRRMPVEKTVSVDVSASTDLKAYRRHGYHLADLGDAADLVVLMTYDYSGPSWSDPGPIGPLAWQRDAVETALKVVPARQLDLGVAGYGYTWPAKRTGRTGHTITVRRARRLVARDGAQARWHPVKGEWSAELSNGTRLWWSDGRSYDLRRDLAAELGVHGTALWQLASADPLT